MSNATVYLHPGRYVLLCRFPNPQRVPHSALGMVRQLRVTPTVPDTTVRRAADVVLTISDSAFHLSSPIRAGKRTIRVQNGGGYRHEVYIFQLAPGKTIEDYWAWCAGLVYRDLRER